jgi:excisionase family DNA binding protein
MKHMETSVKTLSTAEAAERLGISGHEVYRLLDEGLLPYVKGPDGRPRFPVQAIIDAGG